GAIAHRLAESATVGNSTFWRNSATTDGSAFHSAGGAGPARLINVTIAHANGRSVAGPVTLTNSILAYGSADQECDKAVKAEGPNLEYPGGFCNASIQGSDPLLEQLANNGGATPTVAFAFDSPARNAGDNGACAAAPIQNVDQRGVARPQPAAGQCDLGAYEFNPTTACDPDPARDLTGVFSAD